MLKLQACSAPEWRQGW